MKSVIRSVSLVCGILALSVIACGPPTTTVTFVNNTATGVQYILGSNPAVSVGPNSTAPVVIHATGSTNLTVDDLNSPPNLLVSQTFNLVVGGNTITLNGVTNTAGSITYSLSYTTP